MSTSTIEAPLEVSGSMPGEETVRLQEQVIPGGHGQVCDEGSGRVSIDHDIAPDAAVLEELTEKKNYWGFLEGKDAALYLRSSSVPASLEKPIDIPSLMSKLSALLPTDRQPQRRARKLAWHLSKGRNVACEWDNIFLSELTPAESHMSDDQFIALYPDQGKTTSKKGGRPRKYRTAAAQRKAHAERQRRYRARKLLVVADVTKTPSQLAEI